MLFNRPFTEPYAPGASAEGDLEVHPPLHGLNRKISITIKGSAFLLRDALDGPGRVNRFTPVSY